MTSRNLLQDHVDRIMNVICADYHIKAFITEVELQSAMVRYAEEGAISDKEYARGIIEKLDARHDNAVSPSVIYSMMDHMRADRTHVRRIP